jgi:hypothetical protein
VTVVALLVLSTFLLTAVVTFIGWSWKKFKLRNPQSEKLFEAGVSRYLVPRLDPFIVSGAQLFITGGDGAYIYKSRGKFWLSALERWLNRGCTIHYLLCCPSPRALSPYKSLVQRYPSRFYLHELDQSLHWSNEVGSLAKKYSTFHPVLLELGAAGRAMWIEDFHPLDSEYAFGVEFVSPEDGRGDIRFDEYLRDIQALMKARPAVKPDPEQGQRLKPSSVVASVA